MIFFAPGTLVDPLLAPTVRGLGYPPAPPSDHSYGGLGVLLGDMSEKQPKNGQKWPKCAPFVSIRPKTKNGPYLGLRGSNPNSAGT